MKSNFEARKAIESLRAGVPNLAAVAALGGRQGVIVETFEEECIQVSGTTAEKRRSKRGFIIEGNFGSGKSHQLRYLQTIANTRYIPCSMVAVSKETPLGDLSAIYRSAILGLKFADGILGGTLAIIFEKLSRDAGAFSTLWRSVSESEDTFDPFFLASLQLLKRYKADSEIFEQLCDFWDGGQPQLVTWKRLLKDVEDGRIHLKAARVADLAPQRFRFAALALVAAGYSGWFIALDEVELVATFGAKARAKAYESLAFLFEDRGIEQSMKRWFVVAAITEDLTEELFKRRGDVATITHRFHFDSTLVEKAIAGTLVMLEKSRTFRLAEPTALDLARTHERVRALYSTAYGVPAGSAFSGKGVLAHSKPIRSYIREWIAYWDLKMQDNSYEPSIEFREMKFTLNEDDDIEAI